MVDQLRLGFLGAQNLSEDEATIGGLLVTDGELRPLDFRCTSPVRPTALQKLLYGEVLRQYVLVDLLGLTLVQSANPKPDLLLVEDQQLLYLQRKVEQGVVHLGKHTGATAGNPADTGQNGQISHALTITTREGETLAMHTYRGFDDKGVHAKPILEGISAHHDLLEPFRRVRTALTRASQMDKSPDPTK